MHEQPNPIVHASGHPVLHRKPATLIIFQYLKRMSKFYRAGCKLITLLVGEKHRERWLQALRLSREVRNIQRILRAIHNEGLKDLSAHHCDCVGAAARGRHIVSSPPDDVDVFALDRFGIEIENLRTSAPPEPSEGRAMRVAFWRYGGEPGQRASQFSPLVTASGGRLKHVSVAVDR
jgi:hypothetical protein